MSTELTHASGASMPDFLKTGKTEQVGNINSTDKIIPRIKLLQAISPEVTDFDDAKAGEFFHTIAGHTIGKSIRAVPLLIRKTYALWTPRNDDRGLLARSSDGIHWDDWQEADGSPKQFKVKPKGSPHEVTYTLARTVAESGLDQFGTSIPGDNNSAPAAALTYQMLWYFLDHPDLSPAIIINTRSSVKKAKLLISKIEGRPVNHYGQVFNIGIKQEKGDEGPFYNYDYSADGYLQDADLYKELEGLYQTLKTESWRPNDEGDEEAATGDAGANAEPIDPKSRKF